LYKETGYQIQNSVPKGRDTNTHEIFNLLLDNTIYPASERIPCRILKDPDALLHRNQYKRGHLKTKTWWTESSREKSGMDVGYHLY